jgi:hypothetical protein
MTKITPLLSCLVVTVMLLSNFYPAHARRTPLPGPAPEIPETIFAVGDIAKCDNGDTWWNEFFEMVKIVPESTGEEREENEPVYHKLLELIGWVEETDHDTHAEETGFHPRTGRSFIF